MPFRSSISVPKRRALVRRMVVNLDSLQRFEEVEVLPNCGDHDARPSQTCRSEATVSRCTAEDALTVPQVQRHVSHRDELDRPGQLSKDLHGRAL